MKGAKLSESRDRRDIHTPMIAPFDSQNTSFPTTLSESVYGPLSLVVQIGALADNAHLLQKK